MLMLIAAGTVAAQTLGDARLGRQKSEAERCQECHGPTGQGNAVDTSNKAARLAGQHPEYLVKQIRNFRNGERPHVVMSPVARHLDDADVHDIAAYFASQPPMHGEIGAPQPAPMLYLHGDSQRRIVACQTCHGNQGQGQTAPSAAPRLAGQDKPYLLRQLQAWRSGERRNSADGAMNRVTHQLSDPEIEALAGYLSSLQPSTRSTASTP